MQPAAVIVVGLVLARVGAFVAAMPVFASQTPRVVRAGFAMALTAFYVGPAFATATAPATPPAIDSDPLVYGIALVREALIGAAMGFAFGLFLLPARIAGEFVTQQIGLNVSPQAGPTGSESAGPITHAFETVGGLLFLISDSHHVVIGVLHASFGAFPLGGKNLPQASPMVTGLTSAYEMGLLLAAPLALCLFLLAVGLALMARAAPQLNIYSIGFTLQVIVTLVGGLFLAPEIVRALAAVIARTGSQTVPLVLGVSGG